MSVIYQALRKISPAREGEGAEGDEDGPGVKTASVSRRGSSRIFFLLAALVFIIGALLAAGYFLVLPSFSTSAPPIVHRPPPQRNSKTPVQPPAPEQTLQAQAAPVTTGTEGVVSVASVETASPLPTNSPEQAMRQALSFSPKSAPGPQYFPKKQDLVSGTEQNAGDHGIVEQAAGNIATKAASDQDAFQAVVHSLRTAKKIPVPAAEEVLQNEAVAGQAALPAPSPPPASAPAPAPASPGASASLPRTLMPPAGAGQPPLSGAGTEKAPESGLSSQAESRTALIVGLTAKIEGAILSGRDDEFERLLPQLAAIKGEESDFVLKIKAFRHLHKGEYAFAAELLNRVLAANANDVEAAVNMAILEIKSGKIAEAQNRLKKLRRLYPENDTILQLQKKLR